MKFNIVIYEKGVIVYDRKVIFAKYRGNRLFLDLLTYSVLIYNVFYTDDSLMTKIIELFFFLKIVYTIEIANHFEHRIYISGGKSYLLNILKILANVVVFCHFIGKN